MMRPRSMRGPASSINTDRPASNICSAIKQPTIPVPAMTTSAPILLTMRIHLYCPQFERCPIGATAPTLALRLPFLTSSDMRYPYDDADWSALDRDCAADACHHIESDDRRWNATAHCGTTVCWPRVQSESTTMT